MNADRTVWRVAATAAAAGGAALSLVVALAMLRATLSRRADHPQKDPDMVAMAERLLAADAKGSPEAAGNSPLARDARALEVRLRTEYFRRQALLVRGRWLLPFGLLLSALGAKGVAALRRVWPVPEAPAGDRAETARRQGAYGRWAVAVMAAVTGGAMAALAIILPPAAPSAAKEEARRPVEGPAEGAGLRWPRFRGPGGDGVARVTNVPLSFDMAAGRNMRWRAPVPVEGKNSPIVWGKRVFCTGATEAQREVYCFDADDGQLLWRRAVDNGPASRRKRQMLEDAEWAAPTAATDGECVAAIFGNVDLACFDFQGNQLWSANLGPIENMFGHASSLLICGGKVIVQFDQKEDENGNSRSRLLAFEALTGRKTWETPRPTVAAWASPIVADTPGGRQLIAAGNPWAIAYDPADGKELWRAKCLAGDGAPSPIYAAGVVMAGNAGSGLWGIRPDGRGDVTGTHVAWKIEEGLGDICSPVCDGRRVYLMKSDGLLRCVGLEGKKPAVVWEKDFEMPFSSSPSLVGQNLYVLSEKGTLIVLRAGPTYQELTRSELGENCHASPAFVDGRIYIRGDKNLYCIESAGP